MPVLKQRPLVRSFIPTFSSEAAAHVRAGGHAVVLESETQGRLVVTTPRGDGDLGLWAALDIDVRLKPIESGPFTGFSGALVRGSSLKTVREWCTRDSIHEGSTREMDLDCMTCAACCIDNDVELSTEDVQRLTDAGLAHAAKPPYAKGRDGKLVLVLQKQNKRCSLLSGDGLCGVYEARPEMCSEFPPASEGCLYSRDVELGILDGPRE